MVPLESNFLSPILASAPRPVCSGRVTESLEIVDLVRMCLFGWSTSFRFVSLGSWEGRDESPWDLLLDDRELDDEVFLCMDFSSSDIVPSAILESSSSTRAGKVGDNRDGIDGRELAAAVEDFEVCSDEGGGEVRAFLGGWTGTEVPLFAGMETESTIASADLEL